MRPGPAPLRLGAYGDSTGTSCFLDGDLAMPVIYSRALSGSEIATRAAMQPPQVPVDSAVIGCWPLDEEDGTIVADVSGCGRTGDDREPRDLDDRRAGFQRRPRPRLPDVRPDTDADPRPRLAPVFEDLYDCAWPIRGLSGSSYTLPSDALPASTSVGSSRSTVYDRHEALRCHVRRAPGDEPAVCSGVGVVRHEHLARVQLRVRIVQLLRQSRAVTGQPTYYQGIEMPWT